MAAGLIPACPDSRLELPALLSGRETERVVSTKLTKRQQQVVDRAKHAPIVEYRDAENKSTYHFIDGGSIRADLFRRLIDMQLIKPTGDGLFPGHSQTWVA